MMTPMVEHESVRTVILDRKFITYDKLRIHPIETFTQMHPMPVAGGC